MMTSSSGNGAGGAIGETMRDALPYPLQPRMMSSKSAVPRRETITDPMQPRRLEKKANIVGIRLIFRAGGQVEESLSRVMCARAAD